MLNNHINICTFPLKKKSNLYPAGVETPEFLSKFAQKFKYGSLY